MNLLGSVFLIISVIYHQIYVIDNFLPAFICLFCLLKMCPSNFTSDCSIFSAMETINYYENVLMKIFKVHNGAKVVGIVTVTFPPRGGIKVEV